LPCLFVRARSLSLTFVKHLSPFLQPPDRRSLGRAAWRRQIHIELPPILLTGIALGLGLGSLERRSNLRLAKQCQLEVGTSASVFRAALGPFQLRPPPLGHVSPQPSRGSILCSDWGDLGFFDDVHCRRQLHQRFTSRRKIRARLDRPGRREAARGHPLR
jgi:hypothetical protein